MSWRDEFRSHQHFAEALCWFLAVHTFRDRQRHNSLLPPSLQGEFFQMLAGSQGRGPQAIWHACFPDMDEATFDRHFYGRAPMDLACWSRHVEQLSMAGELAPDQKESLMLRLQYLDWAHEALVACRGAFNKKTWDRMVRQKGYMLFTWPVPGQPAIRQALGQRQRHPWDDDQDYLDRHPPGSRSLPRHRMTAVKWRDDRCPLVWQIGLTPYPLKFDRRVREGGAGWAVRLLMDPYEAAWETMKAESRYRSMPSSWGSCDYGQALALLRTRHELFANP